LDEAGSLAAAGTAAAAAAAAAGGGGGGKLGLFCCVGCERDRETMSDMVSCFVDSFRGVLMLLS
jgi:hypothetical protein